MKRILKPELKGTTLGDWVEAVLIKYSGVVTDHGAVSGYKLLMESTLEAPPEEAKPLVRFCYTCGKEHRFPLRGKLSPMTVSSCCHSSLVLMPENVKPKTVSVKKDYLPTDEYYTVTTTDGDPRYVRLYRKAL